MSEVQADRLISLDKGVSVWYDNDIAGNKGWERTKWLLDRKVISLKRAKLPEGKDVGNFTKEEFLVIFNNLRKEL